MTWDFDSPKSKRFTYMGLDNINAGLAGANLLVQAMGTEGKVAILTGVPGARKSGNPDYRLSRRSGNLSQHSYHLHSCDQ